LKSTVIDSSVLGGTGCIGSRPLSVPTTTPGIGPAAGVDADLSTQVSPGAASVNGAPALAPTAGSPKLSTEV